MRETITLSSSDLRQRASSYIARAVKGTRIVFLDPERTDSQSIRLRLMREEIARRILWNGERLSADDWMVIFAASLRNSKVVDGIDPGTRIVLGLREDGEPSKENASDLIELMLSFAAERGIILE